MSDELVKRLRQGGTYQHDTVPMQKAAARIEQLEAALRDLLSSVDALDDGVVDPHSIKDARKALEGKE